MNTKLLKNIAIAGTLLVSSMSYADSSRDEAMNLLNSMNMNSTYAKTLDLMVKSQNARLPVSMRNNSEIMEKYNAFIKDFMTKYLGWNAIKDDMAALYAKHYTADELKELQKFYQTPVGKKSLEIMPQIGVESMQLSQGKLMPHMQELQDGIKKIMSETKPKEVK